MKEEKHDVPYFRSCVKFVGRCGGLLVTGKFEVKGDDVGNKFDSAGAGAAKNCFNVKKEVFVFSIDIRSSLEERLLKKIVLQRRRIFMP